MVGKLKQFRGIKTLLYTIGIVIARNRFKPRPQSHVGQSSSRILCHFNVVCGGGETYAGQ